MTEDDDNYGRPREGGESHKQEKMRMSKTRTNLVMMEMVVVMEIRGQRFGERWRRRRRVWQSVDWDLCYHQPPRIPHQDYTCHKLSEQLIFGRIVY
jgi:hypothetical protein